MNDSTANGSVLNGTSNFTYTTMTGERPLEDTFRILIATDNHLGFSDMNPARENDSFTTFEEILTIAKENDVDFLLLGGDLFHENKPKPSTFQRTIDLLQRHVLGDRPVQFEYLGDPAVDFSSTSTQPEVNYMNPNMNIGLPIFTIHGNHDDPIGGHRTSVVDHLAAANLVNHFGQWSGLQGFDIAPVCLRKGETHIALYGMGHMKDERLFRLIRDNKVAFLRPEEDREKWFNLFVLHQNRTRHGPKSYFPESAIPGFMNVVVWGHEHECRQKEEENCLANCDDEDQNGATPPRQYILQPGSSVATSLCEGEALDKHVFLLQVHKREFLITSIPLKTVRPFRWQTISMADILEDTKAVDAAGRARNPRSQLRNASNTVESYVANQIKTLIDEASSKQTGDERQPTLPLIRLRIEYDDEEQQFNTLGIIQRFKDQVANDDIITFKKTGRAGMKTEDDAAEMSIGAIRAMINQLDDQNLSDLGAHVEEIVEQHFTKELEKPDGQILEILSDKGLSEAIRACVDKDDKESISIIVDAQMQSTIDYLMTKDVTPENIEEELRRFRARRAATGGAGEIEQARSVLAGRRNRRAQRQQQGDESSDEEPEIVDASDEDRNGGSDDDAAGPSRLILAPPRGSTARGGRGSRGGGRGGGAAANKSTTSGRGGRGRGGRGK